MRAVWNVFLILLFLHLAVVLGFGAWLYTSGRLDKDRVAAVVEMFRPTIAEQKAEEERLAKELEVERAKQETAARMTRAADGPLTLTDRMTQLRHTDELTQLKLDRLDRAKADIQGQIDRAQAALAEQAAALGQEREAFDQFVADRTEFLTDEDFKHAVSLLSAQKPRQAKLMLQTMLADGREERVVDYLAAMQTRIASKILAEFKAPAEVDQATRLVNALRARGAYTQAQPEGGNGA